MSFPISRIINGDERLRRIGAPVPDGYWDISPEIKQQEWNGIGSDRGWLKALVMPANFLFPWMLEASLPHDLWWDAVHRSIRVHYVTSRLLDWLIPPILDAGQDGRG